VKRLLLAAGAALGLSTAAQASVIPVLDSVTLVGSEYEFSYSGTLAGDAGLVEGSLLIIFDFLGYVDGSISAGIYSGSVDAFVENTSALSAPFGFDDDPLIPNLVFRWNDLPFQTSGGPFTDVSFAGLSARSIFGGTHLDGYAALTVINNGAATGLPAVNSGPVAVPFGVVPEPGAWAMMILGFGLAGATMRSRGRLVRHDTA